MVNTSTSAGNPEHILGARYLPSQIEQGLEVPDNPGSHVLTRFSECFSGQERGLSPKTLHKSFIHIGLQMSIGFKPQLTLKAW